MRLRLRLRLRLAGSLRMPRGKERQALQTLTSTEVAFSPSRRQKNRTKHSTAQHSTERGSMGNTSSMLSQYDIEEVQSHCSHLFSQREIVSLYQRFCALDRNGKGYISGDEFMSVPEFAVNPLSERLLAILEGLNFKEFVAILSAFSPHAPIKDKLDFIFKVYDIRSDSKVSRDNIIQILRDLSGSFLTDDQRQAIVTRALVASGFSKDSSLTPDDFRKILGSAELKMEVEVPVD